MSDLNVTCPECGTEFEVGEQLAAPLLKAERQRIAADEAGKAKAEFAAQHEADQAALAEKDAKLKAAEAKELAARKAKEEADEAKRQVELTVKRQVAEAKEALIAEATATASEELSAKLQAAEEENARQQAKVKEAQDRELSAMKAKREAEEAKREADLTVQRKLEEEIGKVRAAALKEADEANRLKVADKDQQLDTLRRQIEELKRKGDQGSQQLQGEVQELDLDQVLKNAFPSDTFSRVGKGQRGADVIQTVIGPGGLKCGTILWESKRTKAWSQPWLGKLRNDQRELRADLAALVSETLPDGLFQFDRLEGVGNGRKVSRPDGHGSATGSRGDSHGATGDHRRQQ